MVRGQSKNLSGGTKWLIYLDCLVQMQTSGIGNCTQLAEAWIQIFSITQMANVDLLGNVE
jgi:hypothetical protein